MLPRSAARLRRCRLIELEITPANCATLSLPLPLPPSPSLSHTLFSWAARREKSADATRKLADIGSRRETFGSEFLPINGGKFVTRRGMSAARLARSPTAALSDDNLVARSRNHFFQPVKSEIANGITSGGQSSIDRSRGADTRGIPRANMMINPLSVGWNFLSGRLHVREKEKENTVQDAREFVENIII